jgi:uncharacterized protein (TIGR03437 family)
MLRATLLLLLFCLVSTLCPPALYLPTSPTGQLRRITETNESTLNLNPSLSGDGSRIAFESTADLAATGERAGFHALLTNINDAAPSFQEMSATRAVSPAISQDGSIAAFSSTGNPLGANNDGNSEIFFRDGKTLRQLTDTLPTDASRRLTDGNFQPSITDDGRLIAFSSNRDLTHANAPATFQIFLFDTSTQNFTKLTDTPERTNATDAKISGDGSRIAYLTSDDANLEAPRQLLLYDRTSQTSRVIANSTHNLSLTYGRAISDDGARLVYSAETSSDNASQVFLYDAQRNQTRQLTHLPARESDVPLHPTISGDGKRIAFATRRNVLGGKSDNSVELYLFDIPTNELTQLTNAPAAANAPIVSSLNDDGSTIAFNFPRIISGPVSSNEFANNSEIYIASIAPRPPFADGLRISNAASLGNEPASPKSVAPASIAIAEGNALTFQAQESTRDPLGNFPYSLGGTTVTVNDQPAQIFFVSPRQINFLIPPQTVIGPAEFVVTNPEGFQTHGTCDITQTAPGIFTINADGRGMGITLDAATLQTGPFDPTEGTRRIIIFATGARYGAQQMHAAINGYTVAVESVEPSPDLPGLDEIRLLLPANLRGAGTIQMSLRVDGRDSNPVMLTLAGDARRDIVINELLADPPDGIAGDANHDGTRSASQDEFIELVNTTGRDMDLSGYQILTRPDAFAAETIRHTFAQGTIMPAGTAILIFGGADKATFNPRDPVFGGAQVFTSSTGSLSLINSGGIVTLRDSAGAILDQLSYGGSSGLKGDANQSLTRSPDMTGRFSLHKDAEGNAGRLFSPGTRVDGAPFSYSTTIARIEVQPLSVNIITGAQQQFIAHAFDAFGNELDGIIFRWQSGAATVATINQDGIANAISEGTTEIRALARGIESAPALLTVRPRERILTRIVVSPSSVTLNTGGTQQFTARAFDQDEQELKDATFNWSSNSPGVAAIDEHGLATAVAPGNALVTATARNVNGSSVLNVVPAPLVINEVLADPPDGPAGDANHDGVRSGTDDEFIEIVNSSNSALDISDWTIRTKSFNNGANEISRHTFAKGTMLPALDATVVFGGGTFDAQAPVFGGTQITKATGNNLSLSNNGVEIIIRDANGGFVTRFTYGTPADDFGGDSINQSITRFPDINGPFLRHTAATGQSTKPYSPGTKVDGSFFAPRAGQLTTVTLTRAASTIFVDQSTEFVAQALDQFNRPLPGVALAFTSNDTNVAAINAVNTDPGAGSASATIIGRGAGLAQIVATGILDQKIVTSEPLSLTVEPAPPKVARVEITPLSSSINRGGTQQLTAIALDKNNVVVVGAVFNWTTSDTHVASVNASGLASGVGVGTTTMTASVADGAGGFATGASTLQVGMPLLINEALADVPPDNTATSGVIEGDANRDGARNSDDDEFIELLNNSTAALDLSGLRIFDSGQTTPRFTFPANTTLAAGRALLIFGGGSPPANDPAFGGALVLTVADSATPSGTLSLNDGGDTISLRLAVGDHDVNIASLTYGAGGPVPAPSDQSMTRAPDAEINSTGGDFKAHSAALNAAGRVFSPGTRSDGTPFGSSPITRIEITPQAASINVGERQAFNARAFGNPSGMETEVRGVSFIWDSDNESSANVSPASGVSTTALGLSAGGPKIRARAGGQVATATLNVKAIVASIELTPESASVIAGDSQIFTATARDGGGVLVPDIAFAFSLRDQSPSNAAAITSATENHLTVRGDNAGTATVVARYTQPGGATFEDTSTFKIDPAPPRVTRVEVSPASSSLNRGSSQQFTASGFDEHEQVLTNVKFDWTTNDVAVASIDTDGLARGLGVGAATLTARTSDNRGGTISGQAVLHVQAPLVINEILADPPGSAASDLSGDANRDGVRDSDDDEFVELVNHSDAPLDISGVRLMDATSVRYTFPSNTMLAPEQSAVIFGGGQPPANEAAFGGALIVKTSSLSLNNNGDTVSVVLPVNGSDVIIATQAYGAEGGMDQSLTRAPDGSGDFLRHTIAQGSDGRAFSPGTRSDGTPFGSPPVTRIEVAPSSQTVDIGAQQNFNGHAYASLNGAEVEIHNVSFIWDSSSADRATVFPNTGASTTATALSDGSTTIRARAGGQAASATLTIKPPPVVIKRITVTPSTASLLVGATQQFTAQAFDQNEHPIAGVTFSWSTSDASVADINQDGLATAISDGMTSIRAAAGDVSSDPALLTVTTPFIPAVGELIINEALVSFANSTTQTRRDFLELYNPTNHTLDISGLVVSFRPSGSSNSPATVTLPGAMASRTTLIQPNGYFLIVNGADTFGVLADFNANGFDLNNTTGGIKIELGGVRLDGLAYQGGSAAPAAPFNSYGEGSIFVFTSGTTNDLIRSPNATDTGNNANDFRRNGTTANVSPRTTNPTIP